ncbi:MAG: hypothetical protein ABI151_09330 [Chitinophagaceae bacterium]
MNIVPEPIASHTPNRDDVPHDMWTFFDKKGIGFRLKEYTIGELTSLMKTAGFRKIKVCVRMRSRFILVCARARSRLEAVLAKLSLTWRRSFLKPFLQNRLIAIK